MATLARGNLQGRHHPGRYDAGLADFFGAARLKQPVTQAITVKFVLSLGEYLHERYHGRLYAKAQNLRAGVARSTMQRCKSSTRWRCPRRR